jgi:hypothetical protein
VKRKSLICASSRDLRIGGVRLQLHDSVRRRVGMAFSGALGRGTYQSVVAGTVPRRVPSRYSSASEITRLYGLHRTVLTSLAIRDSVFTPMFPEASPLSSTYRLPPQERTSYHQNAVMRNIRKRSIVLARIQQQRTVNRSTPHAPTTSPDAAAYFMPSTNQQTNSWPNFWQHESARHVVPRPVWRRRADLGGITRVETPLAIYSKTY